MYNIFSPVSVRAILTLTATKQSFIYTSALPHIRGGQVVPIVSQTCDPHMTWRGTIFSAVQTTADFSHPLMQEQHPHSVRGRIGQHQEASVNKADWMRDFAARGIESDVRGKKLPWALTYAHTRLPVRC